MTTYEEFKALAENEDEITHEDYLEYIEFEGYFEHDRKVALSAIDEFKSISHEDDCVLAFGDDGGECAAIMGSWNQPSRMSVEDARDALTSDHHRCQVRSLASKLYEIGWSR